MGNESILFLGASDSAELRILAEQYRVLGAEIAPDNTTDTKTFVAGLEVRDTMFVLAGGLLSICVADAASFLLTEPRGNASNTTVEVRLSDCRMDERDDVGSEPEEWILRQRLNDLFGHAPSLRSLSGLKVIDHLGNIWHES